MKTQYAICFDLDCPSDDEYLITEAGEHNILQVMLYDTEQEAQAAIDDDPEFYKDCCVVEYGAAQSLDPMLNALTKYLK